jgi:formate dehydrogenase subunit gamma
MGDREAELRMEFVRTASNPWGQEVWLGLAWSVLWLVVTAGALFVVVHAIFARRGGGADGSRPVVAADVPAKVTRHGASARISHWILAATTFTLLITAFVPILGLQFPWVTIHWIAGLVFGAYFVYHVIDTMVRGSLGSMWVTGKEIGDAGGQLKGFFSGSGEPHRTGKWGFENKAFHHLTALAGIGVLVTGVLMFMRIDTWFWEANPYVLGLSDSTWGLVYVLHGLSAVGFVGLLMAHIYFAIRPDKLYLTRSMIKGWITKEEYLEHYDPAEWPVGGRRPSAAPTERPVAGAAGPGPSAKQDAE